MACDFRPNLVLRREKSPADEATVTIKKAETRKKAERKSLQHGYGINT
jgi:hypothetical protein